jgi:hypothetical protein
MAETDPVGYKVLIVGDCTDLIWHQLATTQARTMFETEAYWVCQAPPETIPATCTHAVTRVDNPYQEYLDSLGLSVCQVCIQDDAYLVEAYP